MDNFWLSVIHLETYDFTRLQRAIVGIFPFAKHLEACNFTRLQRTWIREKHFKIHLQNSRQYGILRGVEV